MRSEGTRAQKGDRGVCEGGPGLARQPRKDSWRQEVPRLAQGPAVSPRLGTSRTLTRRLPTLAQPLGRKSVLRTLALAHPLRMLASHATGLQLPGCSMMTERRSRTTSTGPAVNRRESSPSRSQSFWKGGGLSCGVAPWPLVGVSAKRGSAPPSGWLLGSGSLVPREVSPLQVGVGCGAISIADIPGALLGSNPATKLSSARECVSFSKPKGQLVRGARAGRPRRAERLGLLIFGSEPRCLRLPCSQAGGFCRFPTPDVHRSLSGLTFEVPA